MKRFLGNHRFYARLFLSYVLVFMLPMLVIAGASYSSLMSRSKSALEQEAEDSLTAAVSNIDLHLSQLLELSVALSSDPLFYRSNLEKSAYRVLLAQQRLNQYFYANTFTYETLFYLRDSGLMFSSSGVFNPDSFAASVYGFADWTDESFKETINTMENLMIFPSRPAAPIHFQKASVNLITLMWQIPRNAFHPYGTLISFVSEKTLASLMNFSYEDGGFFYVVDAEGESLMASAGLPGSLSLSDLPKAPMENSQLLRAADGTAYLIAEASSGVYGLRFFRALPYQALLGNLRAEQTRLLLLVFLTSLLGILLIAWLSRINYHPLRQLFEMIKSSLSAPASPSKNELESTKAMLGELLAREKINQSVYKAYMVERLLRGRYESFEVFNMHGAPYRFTLPFQTLRVAALSLSGEGTAPENWQRLMTLAEPDAKSVFCVVEHSKKLLVVLLNGRLADQRVQSILTAFSTLVAENTGYEVTSGVSSQIMSPAQGPSAYLQAITALDLRMLLGSRRVYFFTDAIYNREEDTPGIDANLNRLKNQLMLLSKQQIADEINEICGLIRTADSLFTARYQCFQAISTIMSFSRRLSLSSPLSVSNYDLFGVSEILSIDELISILKRLCDELCSKITAPAAGAQEQMIQEIMAYLEERALDPDFSLKRMADHFAMSDSNISRYFKQKTGNNISDIIAQVRINEAKILLSGTDLPIRDIVARVGYYDVSSFIRKFKQIVGVTPGEYRKENHT